MARTRNTDRPLTAKEQKFIRYYCRPDCRDIERAAQLAGYKAREGKVLYNRPEVRAEIDRRLRLVELEQARLDAEAEILTDSLIDTALKEMIGLDAKAHGATKYNGIRLALVVRGRIETRNEKRTEAAGAKSAFGPTIYGSVGSINPAMMAPALPQLPAGQTTTTLRRTEEVIQTQAEPASAPKRPHVFEVIDREVAREPGREAAAK